MEARLNPDLLRFFLKSDPINVFQPLCADLLEKDPQVASSEVYGRVRQEQRGIDIVGRDITRQTIVVGQCKRYERIKPNQINDAATEFLKYYPYWKQQGVTRFILFFACDLSDVKVQDTIMAQYHEFNKIDIQFEAWSGVEIQNKLANHLTIAQRYIDSQELLRNICGPTVQGLVFMPNDSIETTLQKLREAMREPDRYYGDIENLFLQEAKKN